MAGFRSTPRPWGTPILITLFGIQAPGGMLRFNPRLRAGGDQSGPCTAPGTNL